MLACGGGGGARAQGPRASGSERGQGAVWNCACERGGEVTPHTNCRTTATARNRLTDAAAHRRTATATATASTAAARATRAAPRLTSTTK